MDMHHLLKDLKERVTRLESALAQQGEESLARLAADDVITTAKFVKKQTRRGRKPAAPLSPLVREDLDRRLQEAPFSTAAAVDRQIMLAACVGALEEGSFSADDLRFLFVILTMMIATPPGAFLEQLRTSAASNPISEGR